MPRVLMVKLSSMGDIIHTLPAVHDAYQAFQGNLSVDWVVEENFAQIPAWHRAVKRVIPVAIRRWRKQGLLSSLRQNEWKNALSDLRAEQYDTIIDAQGLIKSAVIGRVAKGQLVGYDAQSARENLASLLYHQRISIDKQQHAVIRSRSLLAQAFAYPVPEELPAYGIEVQRLPNVAIDVKPQALLFFHGTTWDNKHWPETYWITLAELATRAGYQVLLPWGTEHEQLRAQRIAERTGADVLPRLALSDLASLLTRVQAAVTVDTGLGHLAAALAVPCISLFGPSSAQLSAPFGANQVPLQARFACSPCLRRTCYYQGTSTVSPACFSKLPPVVVWEQLLNLIGTKRCEQVSTLAVTAASE